MYSHTHDQDHIDLIGRYRSAWRRCMNHHVPAATGLKMTEYPDSEAPRLGYCYIMTITGDKSSMVEV
jgi:hypothetical protein